MDVRYNQSLKDCNTFGVDVQARCVVRLDVKGSALSERGHEEVEQLLESGALQDAYMVVGKGSNILFTHDYDGTVIMLESSGKQELHVVDADGCRYVTVGAKCLTDDVVAYCVEHGCFGIENLSAIPGTIGAAVVQNVGAYGVEIGDVVERVEAVDLKKGTVCALRAEDCRFGYRSSLFKQCNGQYLITSITLRLKPSFQPVLTYKALAERVSGEQHADMTALGMRDVITQIRWRKLPRPEQYGSAGSFFKNPVVSDEVVEQLQSKYTDMPLYAGNKLSAGWLIDKAGWKGRSRGRVGVWPQQALVLYNRGSCTGTEVVDLAMAITEDVYSKFNVSLEPEVIIL